MLLPFVGAQPHDTTSSPAVNQPQPSPRTRTPTTGFEDSIGSFKLLLNQAFIAYGTRFRSIPSKLDDDVTSMLSRVQIVKRCTGVFESERFLVHDRLEVDFVLCKEIA